MGFTAHRNDPFEVNGVDHHSCFFIKSEANWFNSCSNLSAGVDPIKPLPVEKLCTFSIDDFFKDHGDDNSTDTSSKTTKAN